LQQYGCTAIEAILLCNVSYGETKFLKYFFTGADYFNGISYYASTPNTTCEMNTKNKRISSTIKYQAFENRNVSYV